MSETSIEQMIYECCLEAQCSGNLEWTRISSLINKRLASLSDKDRKNVLNQLQLLLETSMTADLRRIH